MNIFFLLIFIFPVHATISSMDKIPKIIWQTYFTKDLPHQAQEASVTWRRQNYGYKYKLRDDADIEQYIVRRWNKKTYAFFKALPLGVMKADLWRYLILVTHGGIYSDIDSICCNPIVKWGIRVPADTKHILMLGVENESHFCQWTIAATPRHPAMKHVVKYIVDNWLAHGIDLTSPHFVHLTTGPAIWTDALCDYLDLQGKKASAIYEKYEAEPEI